MILSTMVGMLGISFGMLLALPSSPLEGSFLDGAWVISVESVGAGHKWT